MRPKHRQAAALLPVLVVALVVVLVRPAWASGVSKTYKHAQLAFQLSYPPDWNALPDEEGITIIGPQPAGVPLPPYVSVKASSRGSGAPAPLEQFAKTVIADLEHTPQNFRLISSTPVKLGTSEGWLLDHTEGITETYYVIRLLAYGRKNTYIVKAATMAKSSAEERAALRKVLLTFRPD